MAYKDDKHISLAVGDHRQRDSFDPLLVNLHDSLSQYKNNRTDKTYSNHLMNDVAAILDADLSDTEQALAADVLINLIRQAETDIRKSLSERLAPRKDLHETLLHFLAYDDIDVAEAVLLYSPLLSDIDLMFVIQSKTEQHWQAIAARTGISDRIVDVLIDKKEPLTSVNLLSNRSIMIADNQLSKMTSLAMNDSKVAEAYANYKDLPKDLAIKIYWHVSIALRQKISERYAVEDKELDSALEDCVQDFSDTILSEGHMMPSCLMKEVADLYNHKNRLSDIMLVSALRRRQGRFFIALFAKKTKLDYKTIWSLMRQVGGQGLAVASKALNISKENFVSIFLLSRTIARSNQAVNAEELRMAMRYYDGLTHKMAKDILRDSIA